MLFATLYLSATTPKKYGCVVERKKERKNKYVNLLKPSGYFMYLQI